MKCQQCCISDVILISLYKIVTPHQHRVIHDTHLNQKRHIAFHLSDKLLTLYGTQTKFASAREPVGVLHDRVWRFFELRFRRKASDRRAFKVVGFMYVVVGRENVAHDYKVNFPVARVFNAMEAKYAR